MPYFVLQREMVKRHISMQSIAELLRIRRSKVANRLRGGSNFSIEEAVRIRDAFFPDMEIGLLFDKDEYGGRVVWD